MALRGNDFLLRMARVTEFAGCCKGRIPVREHPQRGRDLPGWVVLSGPTGSHKLELDGYMLPYVYQVDADERLYEKSRVRCLSSMNRRAIIVGVCLTVAAGIVIVLTRVPRS